MSAAEDAKRNADRIVGRKLDKFGRMVGFELLGRLMDATPVDIGRARGNWNVSIGNEDPSWSESRRAAHASAEGARQIARVSLWKGHRLFITNGLPYIGRLNDGYSKQAPAAFIQITTQQVGAYTNRIAQQVRLDG